MREYELINAIKKRCSEAVKDLRLPTENRAEKHRAPKIIDGWFLKAGGNAFTETEEDVEKQAPFVLIRPISGEDAERDQNRVATQILIQLYNDSPLMDGHIDLLTCKNRIYDNIKNNPVLDNQFLYDGGFRWELNESQPQPIWQIMLTMNWLIPNTQRSDVNKFI